MTIWPMLLDESSGKQLPPNVEALLASLSDDADQEFTDGDLVIVLLYVLMIESGFAPLDVNASSVLDGSQYNSPGFSVHRLNASRRMPRAWRSKTRSSLYELNFLLPPYTQYRCRFVALPSPDAIIINLLVPEANVKGRCICLYPPRYVVGLAGGMDRVRFRNLKELSVRFKNSVSSPVRCALLQQEGVLHASLQGLPPEVVLRILALLPARDVLAVAATCREMCHLADDQALWRYLLHRDHGEDCVASGKRPNWREEYRERYMSSKRRQTPQQPMYSDYQVALVFPRREELFVSNCSE